MLGHKLLWQHAGTSEYTAFCPDGQSFFAVDFCGTVSRYDVVTGKEITSWKGPDARFCGYEWDHLWGVAVSPNGKYVAAVAKFSSTIYIWECKSQRLIRKITVTDGLSDAICFTSDSNTYGSQDHTIFPHRPSSLVGGHEPVTPDLERQCAGVVEAVPDFLLPQMIEAFVEVLRPVFSRWGKHGRDAQRKAEPDDLSQDVRMGVRSLEARIVIELSVSRAAVCSPVHFQPLTEPARPQGGAHPRPAHRSPKGRGS